MAITFPIEQPITFLATQATAALVTKQIVHLRDEGMYQFYDPTYSQHRVLILDSTFTATSEVDLTSSVVTVDGNFVYTPEISWNNVGALDDILYVAIVDANSNKYMQNFMPNGNFASTELWTYGETIAIGSGQMTFTATGTSQTDIASYALPLKVGSGYTITINIDSVTNENTCTLLNGATTIGACSVGDNTFQFTATSTDIILQFDSYDAAGTVVVDEVTCQMDFEDVVPEHISGGFCVKDVETSMNLIHGCSNNDYFGMYFVDTGFTPRLRVFSENNDTEPIQEIVRSYLSNGRVRNYYARHTSAREVKIEWLPSYLVNFISIVFLLDQSYIDNVAYDLLEDITVISEARSPEIKAYTLTLAKRSNTASYKRVVNDPDANECTIPLGAYRNRYTDEIYQQRQTDENYYPRQ